MGALPLTPISRVKLTQERSHSSLWAYPGSIFLSESTELLSITDALKQPVSPPRIISIGPTFEIDGEAKATIDLDVDMTVDLAYNVSDLQLFFPPSAGHGSSANVVPQSTRK